MHLLFFLLSAFGNYTPPVTIHVLVALCDNKYQGIVPVPAAIGNGQDPANNLYWGCGYGVKTFLKKQPDWQLVKQLKQPAPYIHERLIFKHRTQNVHLVADAYDGARMPETITRFLQYAAGQEPVYIPLDKDTIRAGGNARLICFVGHNGLMDAALPAYPAKANDRPRDVAIFACASKQYFTAPIRKTGANPLMWTTHLMSPEAYTLDAMIDSWLLKEQPAVTHRKVAAAYDKYQHCGLKGAGRLFVTGW
ncbi:hypothetical protein [uncultured Chitinophaga sp.]|uniref:hypothetical protein n=1 Tax=uncultured Chitinophaga sp. TaxID=339340 RepID=UPI0025E0B273|nr:hypothetical protein [uncultured Chitinophaga sp.]